MRFKLYALRPTPNFYEIHPCCYLLTSPVQNIARQANADSERLLKGYCGNWVYYCFMVTVVLIAIKIITGLIDVIVARLLWLLWLK
jgi:hypothetical protein